MDLDAADLAGVLEAHELPLAAGVGRLVDAAADDHVRADRRAAGADPHVIRIRRRHVDRADRSGRGDLPVADRHPRDAGVIGLPDAAADAAEVEGVRLLAHARVRGHAPAARRADASPLQILVGVRRHDRVGVALRGDRRCGAETETSAASVTARWHGRAGTKSYEEPHEIRTADVDSKVYRQRSRQLRSARAAIPSAARAADRGELCKSRRFAMGTEIAEPSHAPCRNPLARDALG